MTKNKIIKAIEDRGGEVFIVGGAVRDDLLGLESKDIDFLVRLLTFDEIKESISHLGKVLDQEVGGKVSMLKITIDGEEFDIAIPRTSEVSTGSGHGDFSIVMDPHASVESDLSRRDFTINALARDAKGNIIDSFGGLKDIEDKLIRAVGEPEARFIEDPLRMLRALQFAVRFGFEIEEKTAKAIKNLKGLIKTISSERIFMEFEKAWTKGKNQEAFVRMLLDFQIGTELFGSKFEPIAIEIEGTNQEKVLSGFISLFLFHKPGFVLEPGIIQTTNRMANHLRIAWDFLHLKSEIWKWADRSHLAFFNKFFTALKNRECDCENGVIWLSESEIVDELTSARGNGESISFSFGFGGKERTWRDCKKCKPDFEEIVNFIEFCKSCPMSAKELDISGNELMDFGFEGKEIGIIQNKILNAIFEEEISNKKEEILKWIQN